MHEIKYKVWAYLTYFLAFTGRYILREIYFYKFVAMAWSVESLPSNPAARVGFPAGTGILIYVLGLGVCPLSVFCPVLSSAEDLTLCWPHIQGGPPLCICLVFWSRDCCSPYMHLTHGHLACKSLGGVSPRLGRIDKRRSKRRRRSISINIRFQMTDNNTFLAVSPVDLIL